MTPFLTAYFARIGWSDSANVNIETLQALHLLHNAAIPFENLDVLLPREMQLDDLSLEEKLVTARRGGYCFEQNGVFERALREIGFNVRSLLGRVVLANPSSLPRARIVCCWLNCRESSGLPTLVSADKR